MYDTGIGMNQVEMMFMLLEIRKYKWEIERIDHRIFDAVPQETTARIDPGPPVIHLDDRNSVFLQEPGKTPSFWNQYGGFDTINTPEQHEQLSKRCGSTVSKFGCMGNKQDFQNLSAAIHKVPVTNNTDFGANLDD